MKLNLKDEIISIIIGEINKLDKDKIKKIFNNPDLRRYLYIRLGRRKK